MSSKDTGELVHGCSFKCHLSGSAGVDCSADDTKFVFVCKRNGFIYSSNTRSYFCLNT